MKQQTQTVQVPQADMGAYFDKVFPRELPRASLTDLQDCAIEQRVIYILGDMSSGKTNCTKLITNEAIQRYGSENCFVLRGKAEQFAQMLEDHWPKRLCIVLLVEDNTGVPVPENLVVSFFRVREIMMQKTGQREGLIIICFTSHRLHESLVSLRATYTSLLILSSPMNDWDHAFIQRKVGVSALELLENAEEKLEKGNMLVTYRRKFLGATKIPRLNFVVPVGDISKANGPKPAAAAGVGLLSWIPLPHLGHRTPQPVKAEAPKPVQEKQPKRRFCPRCGTEVGESGKCGVC